MTGSTHYDDPGAHCVPATDSGSFYGTDFVTWIPGGEAYIYSFSDGTHVDLRNTESIDPTPRASWDLDEGEVGSLSIIGGQPFAISVEATKPIVMCRMYQDLAGANGMHYIPAKSGTMIGTDFVIDANDPIEVIAYEDATTVEFKQTGGTVNSYNLDMGDHQALPADTTGTITALKAVSVISRATIGATFVPIPVTELDTAPGPPAVFAVRHYPPTPSVLDSSVTVSWATDEPCTSCMTYRRNGGLWMTANCDSNYTAQHSRVIALSSFLPNDLIEYYVWSKDKDNNTVTNNNNGQYYSFTITDDIPQVTVSRLSTFPPSSNDDAYTVNLSISNSGISEARDIQIRERITGMISPTTATSLSPITGYELELTIPVPNIPAFGSTIVSYELIPMLYGAYATYGVGISTTSTFSYRAAGGLQFSGSFSDPVTFNSSTALSWIRGKDYVVATNIGRLRALNSTANAGNVLEEAARFALARDAVVAELETTDRYAIEKLINGSWNGRLGYIGYGGWRFLMFLGCPMVIPSFHMQHKCTWESPHDAPVADNIYADVNTGDDFKPEVILGRLPGGDANRLVNQLRNSLTPVATNRALLMSGTGDGQDKFVSCIDGLNGWLGQYTTHVVRHWKDEPIVANRVSNFNTDVNNTDLIIYRDHGLRFGWDNTIDIGDAFAANYGEKHPMVWSIACYTGDIRANSLAEAFLDGGASLFIGATDLSPRSANNDFAHHLARYHSLSLWYPTMGEAFTWAKRKLIDENISWYTTCYEDARNKQVVNEYNLYGDPKRFEGPLPEATGQPRTAKDGGEGPPPENIELFLPDYVVTTTNEGVDYVSFPVEEGGSFDQDGQPIVPIYIHRVAFGPEFKISDVSLIMRDGLETGSGFNLPIASFEDDNGTTLTPQPNAAPNATFPPAEFQFSWRVEELLDSSHELVLTVFPFYYDPDTTDVDFYRNYFFGVNWHPSNTAVTHIAMNEDVFAFGDPISGVVHIVHTGPVSVDSTLEVDLVDINTREVLASMDPRPLSLEQGTTVEDFGIPLSSTVPDVYLLRAKLNEGELLLDEATSRVRVGELNATAEDLLVIPDPPSGFEIGQVVTATAWYDNIGEGDIAAIARFQVVEAATGELIHEHLVDAYLPVGGGESAVMDWDTSGIAEGSYRLTAVLEYDGHGSDPMTADLLTRRHMGVTVNTDRQAYEVGEKVVVWATFAGDDDQPLVLTPAAWLVPPSGGVVPLQLSYLSTLGIYIGWHYLEAGSPQGQWEIATSGDALGYHQGSAQHFFLAGGEPPVPGFEWFPLTPEVGESVQFNDLSTAEPTSWTWGFGDGATSEDQHPSHVYGSPGEKEVTLGVGNAYGTSWSTQMVTVESSTGNMIFSDGFEIGGCSDWSVCPL